jgi:nitroimidazol reductase NimA-like FMN-containing flavoprotein (pyridoxamine 5'-phosphate oxidase superfamily)
MGRETSDVFGELSPEGIEALLHSQCTGRVAYLDANGNPTIAPFTYAYDGKAFYGYSLSGAKIEGMSARPHVCVEVDRITDNAEWRSVVTHGTFERLDDGAAAEAVARISERLRTTARAEAAPVSAERTYVERRGGPGIAFRITITDKRGRYSFVDRLWWG